MTGKSKFQISRSLDERIKRIIGGSNEYDSEFSQVSSAYILGFNYGNITNCVGLTTNYQLHHAVFPVVGLVFFRNSPNEHDIKASLKSASEFSCSPNGLGSFKSDKNEHLFLIYSVSKDTNSVEKRIFNVTKGAFTRRKRLRLNVLNDPYCPRQVHKGCSDDLLNLDDIDSLESAEDDNVDHLIFFIHGVGGVCDVRFRSCAEVVADFKKMANNLLGNQTIASSRPQTPSSKSTAQHIKRGFFRKHSNGSSTDTKASDSTETTPHKSSSSSNKRPLKVECLPVSWHSCTRKQIGINDQLSLVSLGSVPKLRHFLNKVVMDALLYSSGPVYNQTIINNVGDEINRLYSLFMEKHPNFTGSVSLAGHSLGSVIMFDILAHQIAHNKSPPTPTSSQSIDGQKSNLSSNISSNETERMDVDSDINSNNITSSGRHSENENDSNNNQQSGHADETSGASQSGNPGGPSANQKVGSGASSRAYNSLDELLRGMDLSAYIDLFHKEHIDLNTLLLLTDFDMKELNLPLGVRRKLINYINTKKVSLIADGLKKENIKQQRSESGQTQTDVSQEQASCGKANCGDSSSAFDNMNTGQYLIKYPQLKFEPRCFFSFGSPTPMFLNIRGITDIDKNYKFPTCDRIFNIFHPYDPLAYRFEPLIDPRFKDVEPVQVAHHRGGKRIHVQLREGFAKVGHDIKHRLLGSIRGTWTSFTRFNTAEDATSATTTTNRTRSPSAGHVTTTTTTNARNFSKSASSSVDVEVECDSSSIESGFEQAETGEACTMMSKRQRRQLLKRQALVRSNSDLTSTEKLQRQSSNGVDIGGPKTPDAMLVDRLSEMNCSDNEASAAAAAATTRRPNDKQDSDEPEVGSTTAEFDPTRAGRLNANGRIDYVLQEKPVELLNEYIFAFTSHANYWQNEDSALMVLKEIYKVDNIHLE